MDQETLLRKIESTKIQIRSISSDIAEADDRRDETVQRVYEEAVAGYRSQIQDLELDLNDYQNQLRVISSAK